jgi:hypothetical protein
VKDLCGPAAVRFKSNQICHWETGKADYKLNRAGRPAFIYKHHKLTGHEGVLEQILFNKLPAVAKFLKVFRLFKGDCTLVQLKNKLILNKILTTNFNY